MPKVLEPHGDSNAMPRGGADHDAPEGNPAITGFTSKPYPSTGPAMSNDDVASTRDSIGAMGQDGTAVGAYKHQPKTINAKTGG